MNLPLSIAIAVIAILATFLLLALLGRFRHNPAPQPRPTPATKPDDATRELAEAGWALVLCRLANADLVPLSDGTLDQHIAALPDLPPEITFDVVLAAAARTLRGQRTDHATDTGTNARDLAERMITSAELNLAVTQPSSTGGRA